MVDVEDTLSQLRLPSSKTDKMTKQEVQAAQVEYWYKKAGEGHAQAQYGISVCLQKGMGVEKNLGEATEWCEKAAEQGHALAQFNTGTFYHHGTGVKRDLTRAVGWYIKAAEQGEVRAANNLGVCYEKGIGVEEGVCLRKAVFWYRKAAELGNAPGQCNLGVCFQEGKGVERCDKTAVEWYTAAAKQGYAEAQWRLGRCFRRGTGATIDVERAIAWFEKGAAQEHAQAIIELKELKKEPAAKMECEVEAIESELPLLRTPDLSEMRTCSNPNCKFWDADVETHHCRPRTAGGKVHAMKVHYCSDDCRRGHVTTFTCF